MVEKIVGPIHIYRVQNQLQDEPADSQGSPTSLLP